MGEADNLARRELLGGRLPHVVGPAKQGVEVRVRQAGRVGGLLLVLDREGYRGVLKRRLRRNHCSLAEALDLQLVSNFKKALERILSYVDLQKEQMSISDVKSLCDMTWPK